MSTRRHLTYMVVAASVVLGGMWVAGVPLEGAASWAVLLTCPLMMVAMMLFMNHGQSAGHDHGEPAQQPDPREVDAQYRR